MPMHMSVRMAAHVRTAFMRTGVVLGSAELVSYTDAYTHVYLHVCTQVYTHMSTHMSMHTGVVLGSAGVGALLVWSGAAGGHTTWAIAI